MYRILIAEDEPHLRAAMTRSLKEGGHSVVDCPDGLDAWEVFRRHQFDIVVTDIMMPNMDGYTLASRVKKMRPDIPVLMITACESSEARRKGFESGADDYLVKPVPMKELGARVGALLS